MERKYLTMRLPQAYKDRIRKILADSAMVHTQFDANSQINCFFLNRKDLAVAAHDRAESAEREGKRAVEGDKLAPFVAAHLPGDRIGYPSAPVTRLPRTWLSRGLLSWAYPAEMFKRLPEEGRTELRIIITRTKP